MNDPLANLWHAQPLASHDPQEIKALWRKRKWQDILSHLLCFFAAPPCIWLMVDVINSDAHVSIKLWVSFWMCTGVVALIASVWVNRTTLFAFREHSSEAFTGLLIERAKMNLRLTSLVKVFSLLKLILLVLFDIAYINGVAADKFDGTGLIIANGLIIALAITLWLYGRYTHKKHQKELDWLQQYTE